MRVMCSLQQHSSPWSCTSSCLDVTDQLTATTLCRLLSSCMAAAMAAGRFTARPRLLATLALSELPADRVTRCSAGFVIGLRTAAAAATLAGAAAAAAADGFLPGTMVAPPFAAGAAAPPFAAAPLAALVLTAADLIACVAAWAAADLGAASGAPAAVVCSGRPGPLRGTFLGRSGVTAAAAAAGAPAELAAASAAARWLSSLFAAFVPLVPPLLSVAAAAPERVCGRPSLPMPAAASARVCRRLLRLPDTAAASLLEVAAALLAIPEAAARLALEAAVAPLLPPPVPLPPPSAPSPDSSELLLTTMGGDRRLRRLSQCLELRLTGSDLVPGARAAVPRALVAIAPGVAAVSEAASAAAAAAGLQPPARLAAAAGPATAAAAAVL